MLITDQVGFAIVHGGRGRAFLCAEKNSVLAQIRSNSAAIGLQLVVTDSQAWEQLVEGLPA